MRPSCYHSECWQLFGATGFICHLSSRAMDIKNKKEREPRRRSLSSLLFKNPLANFSIQLLLISIDFNRRFLKLIRWCHFRVPMIRSLPSVSQSWVRSFVCCRWTSSWLMMLNRVAFIFWSLLNILRCSSNRSISGSCTGLFTQWILSLLTRRLPLKGPQTRLCFNLQLDLIIIIFSSSITLHEMCSLDVLNLHWNIFARFCFDAGTHRASGAAANLTWVWFSFS